MRLPQVQKCLDEARLHKHEKENNPHNDVPVDVFPEPKYVVDDYEDNDDVENEDDMQPLVSGYNATVHGENSYSDATVTHCQ